MRKMILFALMASAATATLAADAAPQGQPPQGRWGRPDLTQMRARHADDVALLIGLRPDQRPALDVFLATIMPSHGDWGRDGDQKPMGDAATPPVNEGTLARLDRMSAHVDRANAEAKQRIEATRKFYAGLTPDQQRRFDALERLHHGAMHGRMMEHGHHGPDRDAPPPPPAG